MPYLTEQSRAEIASRVTALNPDPLAGFARNQRDEEFQRFRPQYIQTLRGLGLYEAVTGSGPDSAADVFALRRLVEDGQVTTEEADSFLTSKYPASQWAGAEWGSQTARLAAELAAVNASLPAGTGEDPLDVALGVQAAPGSLPNEGNLTRISAGEHPIVVESLPSGYDPERMSEVLQDIVDQTSLGMHEITSGAREPLAHTIDGSALKPGSIPMSALRERELQEATQPIPGGREAVEVVVRPSSTSDRFVTVGGSTGPGRIWKASELRFPPNYRPRLGPTRYRVVNPGMKFGVLWCRLPPGANMATDWAPGFEVRYGIVIQGIEHFLGQPPTGIMAAGYEGDAPVPLRQVDDDAGFPGGFPGTLQLYHAHARSVWGAAASFPFIEPFGSDSKLAPSVADTDFCLGVTLSLISGRTADEVYQQLNTLRTIGAAIDQQSPGPSFSVPDGLEILPASPANALDWDGATNNAADYTHLVEGGAFGSRLVQGLPFQPSDCAKLIPTETEFSLVVQFVFERFNGPYTLEGTPTAWPGPEAWDKNGIFTSTTSPRKWAVDAIVF